MTKDNTLCWSCGKMSLGPDPGLGHGWLRCSNCGATYHPNPTRPGGSQLVGEKVTNHFPETKYRPRKQKKPRASAKRA